MDTLEGDPGGDQVPDRVRRHVDGIGMQPLLRAFVRSDCLERFWLPANHQANEPEQHRMLQDLAECPDFLVRFRNLPG
jgi:hypothetical protein